MKSRPRLLTLSLSLASGLLLALLLVSLVTASGTWTTLTSAPGSISDGSALVDASNGYLYALRGYGGSSGYLYRYDTAGDSWDTRTAPPGRTYAGDMTYAEDGGTGYLYALRGFGYQDFWRYDIGDDTWTTLSSTSPGNRGALAWAGGDYLYALRGEDSQTFWRYSISGDSWTTRTNAPNTVPSSGRDLVWGGGDYLYALRGDGYGDFWRYSISEDSWTSMASTPEAVGSGGALTWDGDDTIYAFQGSDTTFWQYDISEDSWSEGTSTPSAVGGGASLAWYDSSPFALRGGSTTDFWVLGGETRNWDGGGGDNNWSTAANWNPDGVPTSLDEVVLDNTTATNINLDTGAAIRLLTISGSGVTLDQGANDLTVMGNFTQSNGSFTGGSGTLNVNGTFNLSGGTFTAPSGTLYVAEDFLHSGGTFAHNNGTVTLDGSGTQNMTGDTTFNTLTVGSNVTLAGEGAGSTRINGSGSGDVVIIQDADNVTLQDFTVTGSGSGSWEAGICVSGASNSILLQNLIVRDNSNGVSIRGSATSVTVDHVTAADNNVGGVSTDSSGTVTVKNCLLYNNDHGLKNLGSGTFNHSYNGFYSNNTADYDGLTTGTGEWNADLQFTNPSSDDFTLQSSSPAVDAATPYTCDSGDSTRADLGYTGGGVSSCDHPWYVDDDAISPEIGSSNQPYNTIGEAMSAATAGNTVNVAAGTYNESVTIAAQITLSGAGDTTIISPGSNPGLIISADNVVVEDLKVSGAASNNGIDLDGATGVTIQNCTVQNSDQTGIAVYNNSEVTVSGCLSGSNSNGVWFENSHGEVINNIIRDNSDDGVDIKSSDGAVTVRNNTIVDNQTGIRVRVAGTHTLKNNIIKVGSYQTGIDVYSGGSATNTYNDVYGNDLLLYAGDAAAGTGDISVAPEFTDPNNGDYTLQSGSPCIDAGEPHTCDSGDNTRTDMGYTGGGVSSCNHPWYVDDGATSPEIGSANQPYDTIGEAVSGAINGDTVNVAAGTYNESVGITQQITLTGAGDGSVISPGSNPGLIISANNVVVEDLKVSGATSNNGIDLDGATGVTIQNCTVQNSDKTGIAAYNNSEVTASGCTLSNNTHNGVWFENSHGEVISNTIRDNADDGVDVKISDGAVTVRNNTITGQTGHGVYLRSGADDTMLVRNNTIVDNDGTGIRVEATEAHTLKNNIVVANSGQTGIYRVGGGSATSTYNDVYGDGTHYDGLSAGTGDISADPRFVNAAGDDYTLQNDSPCIDAGDPNDSVPSGGGWCIDMGAFEHTGNTVSKAIVDGTADYTFAGTKAKVHVDTRGSLDNLEVTVHPDTGPPNGTSDMLQRHYELTPTTGSSFTVDLCLAYDQDEVGSLDEAQFQLCRWTGSEWSCSARGTNSSTDDNLVCADDITEMSTWGISEGEPTAVSLARFTARPAVETRFLEALALVALGIVGGVLALWLCPGQVLRARRR